MRAPGKKVGTLRVRLERMTSRSHHAHVEVELRLDVDRGMFHAPYEGAWYGAPTKEELLVKIRRAAEKTVDVAWTRYLVVDYRATAWPLRGDSGRPCSSGSYRELSLDEDRLSLSRPDPDTRGAHGAVCAITSIDLHWSVCEFSTPYAVPEDSRRIVRMRREVLCQRGYDDDEGREIYREVISDPSEQEDDRLPAGAVRWTAQREAFLREVLSALGQLDARMVELFRGDPDQLARRLDVAVERGSGRLLMAPNPDPVPGSVPGSEGAAAGDLADPAVLLSRRLGGPS